MKQTIIAILMLVTISVNAQIKKEAKAEQPKTVNALSGYTLKVDTVKVSLVYYTEDGSFVWKKGFVISHTYIKDQVKVPDSQVLTDEKYSPLKKEELESLYDVKNFNWKQ